jgi:glycogen debranching enzyme
MLMSKNWMIYIWSWDHCFNAISCSYGMPDTAWDQFMIFADHQLPSGQIPDLIGRGRKDIGLIKPPIHGWTLRKIRDNNKLSIEQIGQAYAMLARKTDYMTKDRASVNGLPAINDAMDSGWDNMSECTMNNKKPGKVNYENAGHCSYLILMMDELNELALMLGKKDEAAAWKSRSADLYEKMIARLWTGERFVMRRSDTGDAKMNSQSLNRFMPLILGEKLRQDIRDKMIKDLKTCGNITKWGAATEAPSSPHYKANGYWLGPIWAPPTLFLVDGLDRCGEKALAKDLARLFCDMCAKNGFAENFDAETGAGLRDLAYTWTASTFLILAHEYLQ